MQVFLGNIARLSGKQRLKHLLQPLDSMGDGQNIITQTQRLGAVSRVLQRLIRGEAIGQHDAMHLVRAQRIHRHCRAERRIHPAREAQHHAGKAVFRDIIAQAQHTGGIIGFVTLLQQGFEPFGKVPALRAARHVHTLDAGLKRRHLKGQRTISIQPEGAAIKHQLVLSAHLIEINHRQARLLHPRHRAIQPDVEFVTLIGRAIGHQQNFAPRLGDTFHRIRAPDVLADRNANPHTLKHNRPRQRAGRKHALFIKHAIIGQIHLEAHRFNPALIEQGKGIVEPALLHPGQTDQYGGAAIGCVARQSLTGRAAGLLIGRF